PSSTSFSISTCMFAGRYQVGSRIATPTPTNAVATRGNAYARIGGGSCWKRESHRPVALRETSREELLEAASGGTETNALFAAGPRLLIGGVQTSLPRDQSRAAPIQPPVGKACGHHLSTPSHGRSQLPPEPPRVLCCPD